jgi:hypothetical protein
MIFLSIIPLLAFFIFFLILIRRDPGLDRRLAFLRAAVLWGAYMLLETELLSLVRGVTQPGLVIAWCLPILLGGAWLIWRIRHNGVETQNLASLHQRIASLRQCVAPLRQRIASLRGWHWADGALLLGVLAILGITALLAWVTPPQTWDSLNYHMARVAHWAQDKALRHFTTGIDVQNSMPPGAEMIILQVYVLTQGDKLANFVEWFSMLGSLVTAAYIAKQLGGGRLAQVLAVVVAATIPMGIIQASSTMTDSVVALWVICAAAEALALWSGASATQPVIFASLAAGLALLTKPTAAAFVLPVGIFFAVILFRKVSRLQFLKWGLAAVLLVSAVNAGHWIRNMDLYGNPISGAGRISEHANQRMTPAGVTSNLLRNAALHTGLPWGPPARLIYDAIVQVHHWLGIDPNDPRTTSVGPFKPILATTNEQRAGNFLHALLIGISFCLVLAGRTSFRRKHLRLNLTRAPMLAYVLTAAATFLAFSLLYQWQIFGSRYHMPFFVLFAPVIGLILAELFPPSTSRLAGWLLIVAAAPFLFSIESRPLIPIPNHALVGSVLQESPRRLLLANGLYLIKPYEDLTNRIKDVKCFQVGMMIHGAAAEYPLWVFLDLPRKPRLIEWITTGPSTRFARPDFQPCAIICEGCQQETLKGLSLDYKFDTYRLYLKVPESPPNYQP